MIEYELIASDRGLADFRHRLHQQETRAIAVDFEGEFNLHEYGCRLCLIQVYDGSRFCLIDPFPISPGELKAFLEDRGIVKLFYGADSDRSLVHKQYGIDIRSMYDLKLLVDLLDLEQKGLDGVLKAVLGIETTGKKKFQMHNWTRRPIEREALQYALTDVQHLFRLHTALLDLIKERRLVDELVLRLVQDPPEFNPNPIPTIQKSREYRELSSREKARFQKILDLREEVAKKLNCPPNVVIAKDLMFLIATREASLSMLRPGPKVGRETIDGLVAAIHAIYAGEA